MRSRPGKSGRFPSSWKQNQVLSPLQLLARRENREISRASEWSERARRKPNGQRDRPLSPTPLSFDQYQQYGTKEVPRNTFMDGVVDGSIWAGPGIAHQPQLPPAVPHSYRPKLSYRSQSTRRKYNTLIPLVPVPSRAWVCLLLSGNSLDRELESLT